MPWHLLLRDLPEAHVKIVLEAQDSEVAAQLRELLDLECSTAREVNTGVGAAEAGGLNVASIVRSTANTGTSDARDGLSARLRETAGQTRASRAVVVTVVAVVVRVGVRASQA